jgi:DNA adenine methylase
LRYLGGKFRTAKQIAEVLRAYREPGQIYLEPFVGAGWVLVEMDGKREASDINPYLIAMYQELQTGWIPPDDVSEDMYRWAKLKDGGCPDYLRGFIGIACSWGGKWFAGYARNGSKSERNYATNAKNSLLKLLPRFQGVDFSSGSFVDIKLNDQLIYCDPPYENTTEYDFCGKFHSRIFWDTMRLWSKTNVVVVSGYECPADFSTIMEMPTRTDVRGSSGKMIPRVERLFKYQQGAK